MNYTSLSVSQEDGILIIAINRPDKMNALNKTVIGEIRDAVQSGLGDREISGLILTGVGVKAFAAGADIAEFSSFSVEEGQALSDFGHGVFTMIEQASKPIIAAVNGFALGGGCELAMACHMRVASDNARFGQPEVNLGLIPGYGGTQRLVHLVGKAKAYELLMTADMVPAAEAHRLGLANHVVSQEELLPKCKEILKKIAGKGPKAVSECIRLVNACISKTEDGFSDEIRSFGSLFQTEEFKEGVGAFLDKRSANFTR